MRKKRIEQGGFDCVVIGARSANGLMTNSENRRNNWMMSSELKKTPSGHILNYPRGKVLGGARHSTA